VLCIIKDKVRKRYKFGSKVDVGSACGGGQGLSKAGGGAGWWNTAGL